MRNFEKVAELLGEGFLADQVVHNNDVFRAKDYTKDIPRGRQIINNGKLGCNSLIKIHRYNRFLTWFVKTYGSRSVENRVEAEEFLKKKLDEIVRCVGDWKQFFQWLQKITLSEVSELILKGS